MVEQLAPRRTAEQRPGRNLLIAACSAPPASTTITPPKPRAFMPSRSRVMDSRVTLCAIQPDHNNSASLALGSDPLETGFGGTAPALASALLRISVERRNKRDA